MASNKERIKTLEVGLGQLQDSVSQMERGFADKLQQIETAISKLSESALPSRDGASSMGDRNSQVRANREEIREGGRSTFSSKLAKLEFPRYSGNDPTEWFTRVDQFFEYQGTLASLKVSLASYHLEGEANQWWQWLRRAYQEEEKEVTWEIFVEELWSRFGPTDCEDFDESLSKIRQIGSLRDYQREFERLGNRVRGWTQRALVGTFMGGLKPEIVDGIRMFKPKSLKEAISLARMKDEQLLRQKKAIRPYSLSSTSSPTKNKATTPMKRLTWDEMQKRRAQGRMMMLRMSMNQKSHYMPSQDTTRTMRISAKVGSSELIVLIDSDSTHNFINEKIAGFLKLPVAQTKPFNVKVANGGHLRCNEKFENVPILLQGIPFTVTLYSLPIMGFDMVLGIHWLEQLGTVNCNWKQLTMDFQWNGQHHHLKGIDNQPIQSYSLKDMTKELRHSSSIFAICFLLHQFADIYQQPNQLPPEREINHHINLKEGTDPINVRPYRYAYFQKAEIEKQVHDMLQLALIRASTNGSWRFCTDYRALNTVTVRDRFPIPTVDDMLDELHGAAYFTKLDLRSGFHQVRVHPKDIHKMAFRTHNGHYEYLVMPFGLCNAPSTFQAIMNSIFRPYLRKFVLVFFDDVLIYIPNWNMHLEHVLWWIKEKFRQCLNGLDLLMSLIYMGY
ncbi:hypothetical protein K2173_013241 [Erythroxylum novogranatense]|uniref:Uncharacterized protein n=1 Tax=Erythroxylum novogranatense TaxID=1862640 RepID=A0AAV8SCS3_9ROSI|nr:hypothetical protein K2173_013241 [Erythroxylum novogranatense]